MSKTLCILLLSVFPALALPTPPSIEELVKESDFIAKSKISNVKQNQLSTNTISVSAETEILKAYKKNGKLPQKFNLAFIVFPEVLGKWLRAAPPEGEYIIFYIRKKVKDSSGKESEIISLYEPHPFAFREWSRELEDKLVILSK